MQAVWTRWMVTQSEDLEAELVTPEACSELVTPRACSDLPTQQTWVVSSEQPVRAAVCSTHGAWGSVDTGMVPLVGRAIQVVAETTTSQGSER